MNTYDYVVAKYTANEMKDEPRNVGIIVFERDSKKVFGKFVRDNRLSELKEKNPETNISALSMILKTYDLEKTVDSENYLDELVNSCTQSLKFKSVCTKDANTPQEALEMLFKDYLSFKTEPIPA